MSARITRSKRICESNNTDTPEDSIKVKESNKRKRLTNKQVIHSKAPPPPLNDDPSSLKLRSSESNSDCKEMAIDNSNLHADISMPDKPLPNNLKIDANTSGRWLMKSEPAAFSLNDLYAQRGPAEWDGVRNHVAKVSTETHVNYDVNLLLYGSVTTQ